LSPRALTLHPTSSDILLFTGNYGSGKTEVSVNVANALARRGEKVVIADLDLVNPYFRCREARRHMEELGIKVVAPEGSMHSADLPIVMPEVYGAIQRTPGITVLDVGGDNVGATVLASLAHLFHQVAYEMYFVLNQNRPFTDTVSGAIRYIEEIETASKLKITALVGNTHLMEETDLEMVQRSLIFTQEAARSRGIAVAFVTAPLKKLQDAAFLPKNGFLVEGIYNFEGYSAPVLPVERIMLPPWIRGKSRRTIATHARDRFGKLTGN